MATGTVAVITGCNRELQDGHRIRLEIVRQLAKQVLTSDTSVFIARGQAIEHAAQEALEAAAALQSVHFYFLFFRGE